MALQNIVKINVDLNDNKYTLVNAKQYDRNSRIISVTCYSNGELVLINSNQHSAYVRYKKADCNSVFNFCEINYYGEILITLTEQMLAAGGICCVDLVIVNKGNAKVDTITGEIIAIDNSSIISTIPFYINVIETAVENSDIESSYEYNGLNTLIEKAEAEYSEVIRLARSYAIGDAGGIRENEDTDNSKYYCELANNSKESAEESELKAEYYYMKSKEILDSLSSIFVPMGTVEFSQLESLLRNGKVNYGYLYNISNDFVTDSTFREGAGHSYAAGTNVYYTADGYWDCLAGATVVGVKGDAESNYRKGNVNITAANVGAVALSDVATIDEVKSYLGINGGE